METLFRLVYISDFDKQTLSSDMVKNILSSAKVNNKDRGITGMLLFDYSHFLQVLEGPEDAVLQLYGTIEKDSRHNNVRVVEQRAVKTRFFAQWTMGFSQLKQKIADELNTDDPDPQAAMALFLAQAAQQDSPSPHTGSVTHH